MTDNVSYIGPEPPAPHATRLLPAWFTARMMTDNWSFGLLLTTGQVLCIHAIDNIVQAADGSIWLDVEMQSEGSWGLPDDTSISGVPALVSPTSRTKASVNAASVVAAFELADT